MSDFIAYLLTLRWKALVRSVRYLAMRDSFGLALACGAVAVFLFVAIKGIHRLDGILLVVTAHTSIIAAINSLRNDALFLDFLGISPKAVFTSEYLILAFPPSLVLLFSSYPIISLAPYLISCVFAVIPPFNASLFRSEVKSDAQRRSTLSFAQYRRFVRMMLMWVVPPLAFEWWGGLRQRRAAVTILWTGGIVVAWQPFLLGIILCFLVLIPVEFYGVGEHPGMVEALYRSPAQFLLLKVRQGFRCYALLLTPLVSLGMALHIAQNLVSVNTATLLAQIPLFLASLAASLAVSLLLASLCVVAKYAFYVAGLSFMFAVSTSVVLTLLTLWHPSISVIGIGMSFSLLVPKAMKRLQYQFS